MGRPHPGTERPLHAPLQSFNLDSEVARLRREEEWQQSRRAYQEQRNAITLRKGGGLNLVLFVMKAGERLDEHFAPGPITLIVREGRVRFLAAGEAVEAGPETIVTCDAGVSHSVEALTDTVCILHVAGVR
jgi:quercetin dioxygenase-like cupin family protein